MKQAGLKLQSNVSCRLAKKFQENWSSLFIYLFILIFLWLGFSLIFVTCTLQAIFLSVVGGATLSETAGDLAVAAAICSRHVI